MKNTTIDILRELKKETMEKKKADKFIRYYLDNLFINDPDNDNKLEILSVCMSGYTGIHYADFFDVCFDNLNSEKV